MLRSLTADFVISSMAVQDLVASLDPPPPPEVRRVASALPYRDFVTVGLLVTRMKSRSWAATGSDAAFPPDNWIYIQEPDVRAGPAADLQQLESGDGCRSGADRAGRRILLQP